MCKEAQQKNSYKGHKRKTSSACEMRWESVHSVLDSDSRRLVNVSPWHKRVRTSRLSQSLEQRQTQLATRAWHPNQESVDVSGWQPSKEVKEEGTGMAGAARWGTDRWGQTGGDRRVGVGLPREQRVFDFLAVAELFLSDAKELATVSTGVWYWSNWVIHHTETHTHIYIIYIS